jgi:hypothetical protein
LNCQAAQASERAWLQGKYKASHPTVTAEMIEDQKISQISNLRKQTAEAEFSTGTGSTTAG